MAVDEADKREKYVKLFFEPTELRGGIKDLQMETAVVGNATRFYVMAITPARLYSFTGIGSLETVFASYSDRAIHFMELPGEIPNSELHFFIKQRRAKHFGWLSGAGIYHATRAKGRSSASSADQGPSTPRSKHSATEQRRRAKINDRLEILRELLPHCDQKRDKASFLLEAKVYYRSCWRNTQNNSQVREGDLSASVQDMNKEQCGSKHITVAPAALFSIQSVRETSTTASSPHMVTGIAQNWAKNGTPSNQPPWLSMSTMRQDSDSGSRMLSKNRSQ